MQYVCWINERISWNKGASSLRSKYFNVIYSTYLEVNKTLLFIKKENVTAIKTLD